MQHRFRSLTRASALFTVMSVAGGCMSLSPQLRPTDFQALETLSDRSEREQAYADNAIYVHQEPQGTRYTKGTSPRATKRSWQSLDAILRSDASASGMLPRREMRISRLFTALTVVAGILTVAGTAASAREGLDLKNLNGTGAVLLAGGLGTVGFGITAGVFYGRTKKGYENAVGLYNDSLAVRLGLNTPAGDYIPPAGVLVDEEGFIVLDERERNIELPEEGGDEASPAPAADEVAPGQPSDAAPGDATPGDGPVAPADATLTSPAGPPPPVEPPTSSPAPAEEPSTAVVPDAPGTGGSAAAPYDGEPLALRPR